MLITKVLEPKSGVEPGRNQLNIHPATEKPEQERDDMLAKAVRSSLYQDSLDAWFMKLLTSTAGMKKGSVNE